MSRVCIAGPSFPLRGGIAHYTACLANELSARGNEVLIINYRTLYPGWLFPGTTILDQSSVPVEAPQQQVLRPLGPWTWVKGALLVRRYKPDLILVQWWHVYFGPCLLSLLFLCRLLHRAPVAVICHNVIDHEKHPLLNRVALWLLMKSRATLLVHSNAEASLLPAANIIVSPHPTYSVFQNPHVEDKEAARVALGLPQGPLLLFFGLVRSYKGLEDLLGAVALLKDEMTLHLVIAGEFYDPVEKYEQRVDELGIRDRVMIRNRYIENECIPAFFHAADVLIAPYRTASQSGVVSIARAFALPAIVTDVGGLPEMIADGKTGLSVPPSSPGELASAIRRFFSENLSAQFAPYLQAAQGENSWEPLCQTLERLANS